MYHASKLPQQFIFLCTPPDHSFAFQAHNGLKSIHRHQYLTESNSTSIL